uniref:Uncharacterized protein n=1 Tax=Setaria italica TaxID=4555 RepID=K3YZ90_SETIT
GGGGGGGGGGGVVSDLNFLSSDNDKSADNAKTLGPSALSVWTDGSEEGEEGCTVDLREISMVLVLVFWGNLAGTGSNETVGGGGGRGGGVHKCIRDAVGADLFSQTLVAEAELAKMIVAA